MKNEQLQNNLSHERKQTILPKRIERTLTIEDSCFRPPVTFSGTKREVVLLNKKITLTQTKRIERNYAFWIGGDEVTIGRTFEMTFVLTI